MAQKRTVDLGNQKAVNFTKAIISKYVAYFFPRIVKFSILVAMSMQMMSTQAVGRNCNLLGATRIFVAYANDLAKNN